MKVVPAETAGRERIAVFTDQTTQIDSRNNTHTHSQTEKRSPEGTHTDNPW